MMTSTATTADAIVASAHVGCGAPAPRRAISLAALRERFQKAVLTHGDKNSLLRDVASHISSALGSTCIAYFEGGAGENGDERLHVLTGSPQAPPSQLRDALAGCARQTVSQKAEPLLTIGADPAWFVATVPVAVPGGLDVLLAVFDRPVNAEVLTPVLELAGVYITLWYTGHELAQRETETRSAATLSELLSRLTSSGDLDLACHTLVGELQRFLECRQVVLGLSRDGKSCRVVAMSGTGQVDRQSDRIRTIEAVFDEAVARGELSAWPPNDATNRHAVMAHKKLAETVTAAGVVSSPIRDDRGTLLGAWVFLGEEGLAHREKPLRFIKAAEPLVGSCLALLTRAERTAFQKWIRKIVKASGRWSGRAVLSAIGLLVALMFVPLPYKVKCDCELQPVVRRYVAAPFDATLEKSFVEPGDLVRQDQPLAQIDGREVRWELAGLAAEANRAAKERDGHLATHDFGAAELARHEMERLDIKAKLLEHRGKHLELRSPIDGIVISGDLKKAEGVPLTVGQTLFEVAPLDSMIVEIAIPEEDIRHVHSEQSLEVVLDALPRQRFESSLARIHPRSEVRENEHVFIGEFDLDNPDERLRPGMRGTAEITTSRHALGWNLFHKPWEKLLYWLGW